MVSAFLLCVFLVSSWPSRGWASETSPEFEPGKLVFLLEYIALDYAGAVADGAVVDAFEFREMREFAEVLTKSETELLQAGASKQLTRDIEHLDKAIQNLEAPSAVRQLASDLADRLADELRAVPAPASPPNVEAGGELYAANCAACHGATGDGRGPSAATLDPAPTSHRRASMNRVSPRQVLGAMRFGIEGTAMASFADQLSWEQLWDIAFFVMTLREDFRPKRPLRAIPLSLKDLAIRSNEALMKSADGGATGLGAAELDFYRQNPGEAAPAASPPDVAASLKQEVPPGRKAEVRGTITSGLELAKALQGAFAGVAAEVGPSVVGVTGYVRGEPPLRSAAKSTASSSANSSGTSPGHSSSGGRWQAKDDRYPGFSPVSAGSGFIVRDDGHILTTKRVVDVPEPPNSQGDSPTVDLVDIEFHDGAHALASVVAIEPTIDLAILRVDLVERNRTRDYPPVRVAASEAVSEADRVGHWAIALGNPSGPGKTFAVGTFSSEPSRQCYQENLTSTLIQAAVDAPAGTEGGPLVNIEGEVVGMIVEGASGTGTGSPSGGDAATERDRSRGITLAMPIEIPMSIFDPLVDQGSRVSPWLGVAVVQLAVASRQLNVPKTNIPRTGVYVESRFEPSPASEADIRVGDSIVAIDGVPLVTVWAFQRQLYLTGVDRQAKIEIFREGETIEKLVTIKARPAEAGVQ